MLEQTQMLKGIIPESVENDAIKRRASMNYRRLSEAKNKEAAAAAGNESDTSSNHSRNNSNHSSKGKDKGGSGRSSWKLKRNSKKNLNSNPGLLSMKEVNDIRGKQDLMSPVVEEDA